MADADWLIDHSGIGVADIGASLQFYTAILAPLGAGPLLHIDGDKNLCPPEDPTLAGVGFGAKYPTFWIDRFHPAGARQHTAFRARSRDAVQAFHAEGLAAGGSDNGAPGLRTGGYPPGYYAAFVLDPDGNNIEAVFREPA